MVFFLGAGASVPAPACMPQPPTIQAAALECVAPPGARQDLPLIQAAVPEVYHEVLLDLGGEDTRRIWRVLTEWEAPRSPLARFGLGPNLVHLLVVYLSWRNAAPIVTVNFDQMLERAAAMLGLDAEVSLEAKPGTDSVAIWKLHGSVEDLPSIRTTLQGVTAVNPAALRRIEREFHRRTGCLIGYSGRDVDFFPFLCQWRAARPAYWLTLDLASTAIGRFADAFLGVDAPAEDWARRTIEQLPAVDQKARFLKQQLNRPLPSAAEVRAAYDGIVGAAARQVYGRAFPPGHPKRLLAHASALAALGRNRDADRWADEYLRRSGDPQLDCRAHLLKSSLGHEFARYDDSKRHARLALNLARSHAMPERAAEALLRIDEADRMLYVMPRLPIARRRSILGRRPVGVLWRMLVHAWRLRRLRHLGSAAGGIPSSSRLRASFEYLEHLVRVGAIPQGAAERILPGRLGVALFRPWWRYIERLSYRAGYAAGIGNARKFGLRRMPPERRKPHELSVLDLYRLVPSPTGESIYHRDVADVAATQARRLSGPAADRKRREAVAGYGEAIRAAREASDPSLELKAMFGLQAVEPGRRWPEATVRRLVEAVQSPTYARLAEEIVDRLCRP